LKRVNNRLLGLAVAAAIVAAAPTASAFADSLTGAGSTLVAPLMAQWGNDFQHLKGSSVTYGAVGSGAGISQISARTVDFGASDAPLTPSQSAGCHGCVQVPWALTATAIAFHVNNLRSVRLSGPVLVAIYLGQITNWNDPRIKALNKGVALPNLKITPVFRSDGSGDTYAFTDYLSRVSKTWRSRVGNATSVSFPTGVGGKGNAGETAIVGSTNGTLSYISASYVIAHGLGAAALQNAAGKFVFPNLKNIKAAGAIVKRVPPNNAMHIVNPPKSAPLAYPLSTFTYAIVPTSTSKASLLKSFIQYAMTTGQKFGPALDFSAIPKIVLQAGQRTLSKIH
jgi:phosphate transport system substrate-binding protein